MSKAPRKKTIPKPVRDAVWNTHVGADVGKTLCVICGKDVPISEYECGHIISEKNGGKTEVKNLLPIHGTCNKAMGKTNLHDYVNKMKEAGVVKQGSAVGAEKKVTHIKLTSNITLPAHLSELQSMKLKDLRFLCGLYEIVAAKSTNDTIKRIIDADTTNPSIYKNYTAKNASLQQLKKPELIAICKDIGETVRGTKNELIAKIIKNKTVVDINKYKNISVKSTAEVEEKDEESEENDESEDSEEGEEPGEEIDLYNFVKEAIKEELKQDTKKIGIEEKTGPAVGKRYGYEFHYNSFKASPDGNSSSFKAVDSESKSVFVCNYKSTDMIKLHEFMDTYTFDKMIIDFISSEGNCENFVRSSNDVSITFKNPFDAGCALPKIIVKLQRQIDLTGSVICTNPSCAERHDAAESRIKELEKKVKELFKLLGK